MTARKSPTDTKPDEKSATPGKPVGTGSRQQTHPNQNSQSGSDAFDKEQTRGGGDPENTSKPASAK